MIWINKLIDQDKNLISENIIKVISKHLNYYIDLIKFKLMGDELLKENYKMHLKSINQYLVSRYWKFDLIKQIYHDQEYVMHTKMMIVK